MKKSQSKGTGDLIGNKVADKITNVSKKLNSKKPSQKNLNEANNEIEIPKEKYIYPEKRQ